MKKQLMVIAITALMGSCAYSMEQEQSADNVQPTCKPCMGNPDPVEMPTIDQHSPKTRGIKNREGVKRDKEKRELRIRIKQQFKREQK